MHDTKSKKGTGYRKQVIWYDTYLSRYFRSRRTSDSGFESAAKTVVLFPGSGTF